MTWTRFASHLPSRLAVLAVTLLAVAVSAGPTLGQSPTIAPSPSPRSEPTTVSAFWLPYLTSDGTPVATSATNIKVDERGGVHMTYRIDSGQDGGHRPAYYVYCAARCTDPARWTRTSLGDNVLDARLQLTPEGHPRVMLHAAVSSDPVDAGEPVWYEYAACDVRCEQPASWTITRIASAIAYAPGAGAQTNDYFALDPQGHPAFVYYDTSDHDDHGGTFYESCLAPDPADCTDADQWHEITVASTFLLDAPELAFTPAGEPRFVGEYVDPGAGVDRLVYGECDPDCTLGAATQLFGAGAFDSYSLRLDSQGRPRIVFYTGNSGGGEALDPYQLYYLWCDTDCTTIAGWNRTDLHTAPGNGWSVDLALDAQDRPRFVYKLGDVGPGYAWCDVDCETDHPAWRSALLEDRSVLEQEDPVTPIADCTESAWTSGHDPSLALTPDGDPWVAFDTRHQYAGTDLRPGHLGEPCPVATDIAWARVLAATHPAAP